MATRYVGGLLVLLIGCSGGDKDEDTDTPFPTDPQCVDEIPYDGIDQDCDGADLVDVDLDGHDAIEAGGDDCDDADPSAFPGAAEVPYDSIDQDCDGADLLDADLDGHDAIEVGGDDCDDADGSAYPGAPDNVGDGVDQSCDGIDGVDRDGDGYAAVQSDGDDCDDLDPARNPGAAEIWYDGIDQDCDRQCDYDADGDGAVLPGSPVSNGDPCDIFAGPEWWAPEDCDDDNPAASTQGVTYTDPRNGENNVDLDQPFTALLAEVDPGATLTLADAAGSPVPGIVTLVDQQVLIFTPDAPLAYSTAYTATVTHGCGVDTITFTTEAEPIPVVSEDMIGLAWDLDLASATWTEPLGVGDLIRAFIDSSMLVEVIGAAGDALDLRFGSSRLSGGQDLCTATVDTTGTLDPNPTVVLDGPLDLETTFLGLPMSMLSVSGSIRIDGGGTAVSHGTLSGLIDTSTLGDAFGLGYAPDAICQLLGTFGALCEACPDDGDPYCTAFAVENIDGSPFPDSLTPRTSDEIAADPSCP